MPQLLSWHRTIRERPLKEVLTSGTYRGPSRDSQGTSTRFMFSFCIPFIPVFYKKNKYANVLNGYVREMSTGSNCDTFWGPNKVTF